MTEKLCQPKLRFPEFQYAEDWESRKLGKIVSIINDKAGNRKLTPMSITAGVGLVSQMEKFGREIAGTAYKNYFIIRKNDFAYNKSSTKEYPEGYIALYSGDNEGAVPNSIFICFRVQNDEVDPKYLNYLFSNNTHGKWLRNFITVGARAHGSLNVNNNDLLSLPIPLPKGQTSKKEQQKIADCLSSIDELITAESKKLDALKVYKKGLMQQLFPAEGETLPKLRFPEFRKEENWETIALQWIAKPVTDKVKTTTQQTILTLSSEQGLVYQNEYFGKRIAGKNLKQYTKIIENDFVYNDRATKLSIYGTIKKLSKHEAGVVSPIYKCFRFNKHEHPSYWEYYFESGMHESQLYTLINEGARSGRFNITIQTFLSTFAKRPKPEEQGKIANILCSIEDLITNQRKKTEALKNHKKGLMQKLFPTISEL